VVVMDLHDVEVGSEIHLWNADVDHNCFRVQKCEAGLDSGRGATCPSTLSHFAEHKNAWRIRTCNLELKTFGAQVSTFGFFFFFFKSLVSKFMVY
jgi:hypothetical protein